MNPNLILKASMQKLIAGWLLSLALAASAQPLVGTLALTAQIPDWLYTVRAGDTLIGIGQRYLMDAGRWPALQRLNRIADPRHMPPATVLRVPANLLRSTPGQATLKVVHGNVRWRETSGPWQSATQGQRLSVGSEVQTDDQANAVLELANGTRLGLNPGSILVLDTISLYGDGLMADTRLRLQQGQAEITDNPARRAQQNLRVLTPSAQAVVRGTVFRVGVQTNLTREETLSGVVDVGAGGRTVSVAQMQGTVARAGEPPLAPRALLAAPDVSALPQRLEQLPLRFALPAAPGVVARWGQISPDESFDVILAEKASQSAFLSVPDLPNGDYILRVRHVDDLGLQGLEARHRFKVWARPFAPTLEAPVRLATLRAPRPSLSWIHAVDAARYRVQLATSADFSAPLADQTVAAPHWAANADVPVGNLHWRVANITATGENGPWSATETFSYKPAPGQPDLSKAALRFESDALLLDLAPPPPNQHYQVSISANADSAGAAPQHSSADGQLRLPRPDSGEQFLGVRLVDDEDGTTGPAMLQKITVPSRYPNLWVLLIPILFAL